MFVLCLIRRSQLRISVKNILLVIRSRNVIGCCGMRSRMGLGLFGDRFGAGGSGIPEKKEVFWALKNVLFEVK